MYINSLLLALVLYSLRVPFVVFSALYYLETRRNVCKCIVCSIEPYTIEDLMHDFDVVKKI